MRDWSSCKNILCIRADNMGDLLMSSPAIRNLKRTFGCKITLLTSSAAAEVASLIEVIDEVLVFNFPWVDTARDPSQRSIAEFTEVLKRKKIDGCIVFTVYSQSALPALMLAYLSEIPLTLAYCRENPYGLLSHWIPEKEPYDYILHQVQRDLDLVKYIGAGSLVNDEKITISLSEESYNSAAAKLLKVTGVAIDQPFIILHAGVSEKKRRYPSEYWVAIGKLLLSAYQLPVLLTGTNSEKHFIETLAEDIGVGAYAIAGLFSLAEFAVLIKHSLVVLSVNTGTTHICAAVQTPVVVLYARTNPQHAPWKVRHVILEYNIQEDMKSKNEVIRYVDRKLYNDFEPYPDEDKVLEAVNYLLGQGE